LTLIEFVKGWTVNTIAENEIYALFLSKNSLKALSWKAVKKIKSSLDQNGSGSRPVRSPVVCGVQISELRTGHTVRQFVI